MSYCPKCKTSMSFVGKESAIHAPSAGHAAKAASNPYIAAFLGAAAAGAGVYNFFYIKERYRCKGCGYETVIERKKRF